MSEHKQNLDVIYEQELERINKDPSLYMTPGARRYFKRVAFGYAILAIACAFGIWGVTQRIDSQLRKQLNILLVQNCEASIPTLKKFNQGVRSDIEQIKDNLFINTKRGDYQRIAANKRAIVAKKNQILHVPTVEECKDRKAF